MKLTYNAPFTLTFALVCIVAFVLAVVTGGWSNETLFSVGRNMDWSNPLSWLRTVTHVFGHASTEHLVYNLSMILLLGPILEEKYSEIRLVIVALITALLTGLTMIVLFPGGYLLGASGVVFALIILSSFANARSGTIPMTFVLVAILYLGNEIYMALHFTDRVARFAHIIGGVVGGALGVVWSRGRR